MSALVNEKVISSMSPGTKKRPLSVIEETNDDDDDDDATETVGSEQAEKENDAQEIQETGTANGHVSDEGIPPEVMKSPSFKAIKQFFIDKTENHNNSKITNDQAEKSLKTKKMETRKKSGTDGAPPQQRKISNTKSPDSSKINSSTTSSRQQNTTSSKPPVFSRSCARIAPKTHPVTRMTTTTTTSMSSKKLASTPRSSTPTPITIPTIKPGSSLTAPTAATQAREQAVRKSSSFGAIDRLRAKTSSPVPTKVTKSNSIGKNTPKKTVTKRDSTGSLDKERKPSKKSEPKQRDKLLDRSFTDSPLSQLSETDSVESNSTDNSISTVNKVSNTGSNAENSVIPNSYQHLPSEATSSKKTVSIDKHSSPSTTKSESTDCRSQEEQNMSVSSETTQTPKCDSETISLLNNKSKELPVKNSEPVTQIGRQAVTETSISSEKRTSNPAFSENSSFLNGNSNSDSQEPEEKTNDVQNVHFNNSIVQLDDRLKNPLSLTMPSTPSIPLIQLSPSSLSPSLNHIHSPRASITMPKFRTSPTLSRKYSVERISNNNNNNKTITLNGKLASVPAIISASNTFPRSISKENSAPDLAGMDENKDHGYILDKARFATIARSTVPNSPLIANIYRSARRGSYFFKRNQSTDSLSSLSEGETLDNTCEDTSPISASDLNKLKETAERLHLTTRRASILSWRQNNVDDTGLPRVPPDLNGGDTTDENLTVERKQKINEALDWLRTELQDMRTQDQALARQLLTIREDIHQLKLQRYTEEHQDLLDDFKTELEELEEYSDVLDLPHPIYEDNPLKHIGITRHNMNARRFSAC